MSHSLVSSPTSSERMAAVVAHGGTLFAWFLAPLIVYVVARGDSRYVERQALSALAWSAFGTLVSLATCGLAIPVFMVFHVIAAIRAYEGGEYEYPIVTDFVRGWLAA